MSIDREQPGMAPGEGAALCLRDMGAFHVGGAALSLSDLPITKKVLAAGGEPVRMDPNGTYWVGQMYAQYFFPAKPWSAVPLQLWHGGGLTGACWETTPDGRPGWLNYFLKQGWDTYLCDAAERGRSGYAPQHVWGVPISQTAESVFERFRIGEGIQGLDEQGLTQHAFPGGQFPSHAFASMVRQLVPRWAHTDSVILEAYAAMLERTGPSVVMCHSQGGMFGLTLAMAQPEKFRAVVALEPAAVPASSEPGAHYDVPTLIILGDRIETDARWPSIRARIREFAERHPSVDILSLPELGMTGNSHMLMMDANSQQIAGLVQQWLARKLPST